MTKAARILLDGDMITAFYPGSFDPMTNGHLDVLTQALAIAPRVVIGIGVHPGKVPMFSFDERAALIRQSLTETLPDRLADIEVVAFDTLVVDAARKHGTKILIRGLRDGTDLDYEMQMAGMNAADGSGHSDRLSSGGRDDQTDYGHIGPADRGDGRRCQRFRARPVLTALQARRAS